jgi:tetratricopeptide (TPR) repeat protein
LFFLFLFFLFLFFLLFLLFFLFLFFLILLLSSGTGTLYALEEHYGAAQQMFEEAIVLAPLSTSEYHTNHHTKQLPSTKADPLSLLGALNERLREYDKAEECYLRVRRTGERSHNRRQ